MRITWIVTAYSVLCFSACYDLSLDKRDGGSDSGNVIVSDASGITASAGNLGIGQTPFVAGGSGNIAGSAASSGVPTGTGTPGVAGSSGLPGSATAGGAGSSGESGIALPDAGLANGAVCDATSCANGCCAGTTCVEFNMQSSTQCGAGGAACKSCPAGQSCGSTGACGCDPTSCPKGCCADGKCVLYENQLDTQCGAQGAVCAPCVTGQTCGPNGKCVCDPTTCPNGCCADNKCILSANQSNSGCGSNGNACGTCGAGESCLNGACSCGGTSCSGCCSNGACVNSSNGTCGVGGGECKTCAAKQRCSAQGECICDATSCPNGCCDADKNCQTPSASACNTGGKLCLTCSLKNATASCDNGQCAVASCTSNTWGDCDDDPDTGCETNILTTTAHCGTCNNSCQQRTNATTPSCSSGKCVDRCNTNWGDCDGNTGNGCETNFLSTPAHCSGCGQACASRTNASSVRCENGVCAYTCKTGFYETGLDCAPVDCGTPSAPTNGGSVTYSSGTTFGKQATYSCPSGYTLNGEKTATCLADRNWSGSTRSCVRDPYCGDSTVNNGEACDWGATANGITYNKWSCGDAGANDACKRRYIYTPCQNQGYNTNDCPSGFCIAIYGSVQVCYPSCEESQKGSSCSVLLGSQRIAGACIDSAKTWTTRGVCLISCTSNSDCPLNATCNVNGSTSYCFAL